MLVAAGLCHAFVLLDLKFQLFLHLFVDFADFDELVCRVFLTLGNETFGAEVALTIDAEQVDGELWVQMTVLTVQLTQLIVRLLDIFALIMHAS